MADVSLVLEAAALVFVVASLAMPAGIGGGLLYVPLLLLLGVTSSASASAALSQPIIVGAALAANVFNFLWQIRHPEKRLVEPRLAVATIAPCLAGVTIGALLNRVLPEVSILLLLVITIVWNLINSLRKAVSMWRKEGAARTPAASPSLPPAVVMGAPPAPAASTLKVVPLETHDPSLDGRAALHLPGVVPLETPTTSENPELDGPDTPYSTFNVFDREDAALRHRRPHGFDAARADQTEPGSTAQAVGDDTPDHESRADATAAGGGSDAGAGGAPSNARDWLKLVGIFLFMLASTALRGGKGGPSVFEVCSWPYWVVTFGSAGFLLVVGFFVRHPEISMGKAFGVGVLSAIVGIGGGLVLNPMLLSLGMDAMKATATVTVMMLMICTSATFTFAISGSIPLLPMAILSTASFLGSFSGKTIVGWVVAHTGRTSILVFMLAAFLAISGSVVILRGVLNAVESAAHGETSTFLELRSPCPRA